MKKLLAGVLAITILAVAACNNNKQINKYDQNMKHDSMNHDKMQMDTMKGMNHRKQEESMTNMGDDIKSSEANAGGTDPVVRKFINNIISEYLFIKNGLAADDKIEPKKGAVQMVSSIRKFDKSFFKASQKKEFDIYADNINEQLQGIITAKQIEEQRALFGLLSQQVYELAKLFGANRILYYDHCPMALNNKGAMWLSEIKEIKNPFLGNSMLTCGTVQEIVQ
jgi:hypothetical protein